MPSSGFANRRRNGLSSSKRSDSIRNNGKRRAQRPFISRATRKLIFRYYTLRASRNGILKAPVSRVVEQSLRP
jgi:hypothetical protein